MADDDPFIYGIEREHDIWISQSERDREAVQRLPSTALVGQLLHVVSDDPRVARLLADSHPPGSDHAGCFLANGAYFHREVTKAPEYAGPECKTPRAAMLADRAGAYIVQALLAALDQKCRLEGAVRLIRNNTGYDQGREANTCGTDENYRMSEEAAIHLIKASGGGFVSHLASRGIYAGAGEVLAVSRGYLLTARARYMRTEVGKGHGNSTRAMIKITGASYDAPGHTRVQVASGDTTMSPWSTLANLGPTSLLAAAYEDRQWRARIDRLALVQPVVAMGMVSEDADWESRRIGQSTRLTLVDGLKPITALDHQRRLCALMVQYLAGGGPRPADAADSLALWEGALEALENNAQGLERLADVFIKRDMLERVVLAPRPDASGYLLRARDLQYHDLWQSGIYNVLVRKGYVDESILNPVPGAPGGPAVSDFIEHPPQDTRARVRGAAIRHASGKTVATTWGSIVVNNLRHTRQTVNFGAVTCGAASEVNRVLAGVDRARAGLPAPPTGGQPHSPPPRKPSVDLTH